MFSILGIPLGILIGIISAVVMIKFLEMLLVSPDKQIHKLIASILAIPTFWFGGPWLATTFLKNVNLNDILDMYVLSLSITFIYVSSKSLKKYIDEMARDTVRETKRLEGGSDA